jgi:hypothetical protein
VIGRLEVLPGAGTAARFDQIAVWAGAGASGELLAFLLDSARNLGSLPDGGARIAGHLGAVLSDRRPEPNTPFVTVGPGPDSPVALLHGPIQMWDGARWVRPDIAIGWIRVVVPNVATALVTPIDTPAPPSANPILDLLGGVVPGGGLAVVLTPAAPSPLEPSVIEPSVIQPPVLEAAAFEETAPYQEPAAYEEPAPYQEPAAYEEPAPYQEPAPYREPAPYQEPAAHEEPVAEEPALLEEPVEEEAAFEPAPIEPLALEPPEEPAAIEPPPETLAVAPPAVEPIALEPISVEPITIEASTAEAQPAEPQPVAVEPPPAEPPAAEPQAAEPQPAEPEAEPQPVAEPVRAPEPPSPPGLTPPPASPLPLGTVDLRATPAGNRPPLPTADQVEGDPPGAVRVQGVRCPSGHFNHAGAATCLRCGLPLDPARGQGLGPRPPLGVLISTSGSLWRVDASYLVGTDPTGDPAVRDGVVRGLVVAEDGQSEPVHAELRATDWTLSVVDRRTRAGTFVLPPGTSEWQRVPADQAVAVKPGTHVAIGSTVFTFTSPWPL